MSVSSFSYTPNLIFGKKGFLFMNTERNNSGIFKKKKRNFSMVSNTALTDRNLSLQAKGLYALIESLLSIDGFTLYKDYLIKCSTNGRDATNKSFKELKNRGYLLVTRHSSSSGFYYEYELLDEPIVDEITDTKTKDCNSKKELNNATQSTYGFSVYGKPVCGKSVDWESDNGKSVQYNNTLENNTIENNSIINNITNNTDVVDYNTHTTEEVFDTVQNKISLEKLRLQDAYQLEQNFYTKPDSDFKKLLAKLTKTDKATVYAFTEDKTWDLYWKFLLLNKFLPDDFNELPEGIKSPNAYLIGIIRNISKDSDY